MDYMTPPDNPGTFGRDFNYSVWTPGTQITVCNVPWNSDYRDIVSFDDQKALNKYLKERSGPTVLFDQMTYARAGQPVRVNLPFNDMYWYNYLMVHNDQQPVGGAAGGQTFYYFIQDVRHVAPNTTELLVQLDVWQTFGRYVEFGNSYVERGHIGIANENQMNDNGREFLTIPEGFDLGSEYVVAQTSRHTIGENTLDINKPSYDIIVTTTVSFDGSGGTVDDPKLETAKGSAFESLPNGAEMYHFKTSSEFRVFMAAISEMPWVSQGIVSVQAVPEIPESQLRTETVTLGNSIPVKRLKNFTVEAERIMLRGHWRNDVRGLINKRYRHLNKFFTYPYSVVELTTYSGNPLVLKPESMYGTGIHVVMLMHLSQPAPRVVFYPFAYNSGGLEIERDSDNVIVNDNAEFLDMTTGIFNLPTFSLVNNSYMSFMANNANTIPYQQQSADWSQQRALTGNTVSEGQASQSMDMSKQLTQLGISGMAAQTDLSNTSGGYRAIQQGVGGILGGAMRGGGIGAASGALSAANTGVGYAIDVNQRNQSLAIETGLASGRNKAQLDTAGYMRDTNKDFADFAAKGDYSNAIAGINAKVQDAKMLQPTTSGQMGGDAFNLVQYLWAIHAKVKMLQPAAFHAIGEFWLRYGYSVNRFIKPPASMRVMSKFTYWKMSETYITGSFCPEQFKQTIRGIFEKGVTVWTRPEDIGNIDIADNDAISGVKI